ncbi:MAG: VIT1/CCC1 transporter family protein [Bacteroidia bacterium]|jgi:VIT1/CCC1 family predicted Fe2+/Mn2+ transporter|nr:VIT1/CCC1 transporter family protein [Bacteroidia bacterium]
MQHNEQHFSGSQTVRDMVIGLSDGLTVPFALAAGLTGAIQQNDLIVTAGMAEIVAGSIAMGLGGYLAGKTEIEHYDAELKREYAEVEQFPEKEKQEVTEVLESFGLSETDAQTVVNSLSKDKHKWVQFMMRFELGLEKPDLNRARTSALTIGLSYIAGGIVPLSAYFFTPTANQGLIYSCVITGIALFGFGYLKSAIIGQSPIWGALRITGIGALAAASAYAIAHLFQS